MAQCAWLTAKRAAGRPVGPQVRAGSQPGPGWVQTGSGPAPGKVQARSGLGPGWVQARSGLVQARMGRVYLNLFPQPSPSELWAELFLNRNYVN